MKYLFIHQNYPGQFRHLAPALAVLLEHQVVAVVDEKNRRELSQPNLRLVSYPSPNGATKETHWYLHSYEAAIRRGQQVARLCMELRKQGFVPDIICAHAGWGEALFLRDVFPDAVIVDYFEFFYHASGSDVGFDRELDEPNLDDIFRLRVRNACHLQSLESCDWGLTPTAWQASRFPEVYRPKISIMHEGVDTDVVRPESKASFKPTPALELTAKDQVITFVNRNLEPYRGFHIFMRALPKILRQNPKAHVVVVGGDEISYGRAPREGGTWRQKMLKEVGAELDLQRVHFVGKVPYERYLQLLQISSVHVYLTYPFVLSWSMLEAMAAGCLVIGSNTPPVTEVLKPGHDGLLVDFFDVDGWADTVTDALHHADQYQQLRINARNTVVERYDLKRICLPQQLGFLQELSVRLK
ncbi:MAG TPA: glycosyltransferase family 4 protein [Methylophilaceae bacterium]|nr:glycosyltransferase family 4 protein [Methylophilaceae bacterium]